MKRFCSHYALISPDNISPRTVVEQSADGLITDVFSLTDGVESAHTSFCDGIISLGIISLADKFPIDQIKDYHYINLANVEDLQKAIIPIGIPLVLDFATTDRCEINKIIKKSVNLLSCFSFSEIISACVYYPRIVLGRKAELAIGVESDLIVWQGINWEEKRITGNTQIINLY